MNSDVAVQEQSALAAYDVDNVLQQADQLEEQDELEQAEALLVQALKLKFAAELHVRLINISSRLKHFDIAMQSCQALLDDEDTAERCYLFGQTQERMQDWQGAKATYLKVLESGRGTVRVYYRLATICNLLEQEE